MTEPTDDNIPTVDKIVYIERDDQGLLTDTDLDNDDLHVCRKCNKVFKSLEDYIEHKVKYENYRISQTRSKLDRRMVLPQLVQKQRRKDKKEQKDEARKIETDPEDTDSSKQTSIVILDYGTSVEKASGKEDIEVKHEEKYVQNQAPKKRGRKKKSQTSVIQKPQCDLNVESTYKCTTCGKRFRREATLRWHMTYEHKEGKENDEDSDDEIMEEASTSHDGDFKVEMKKDSNNHHFENKNSHEIHVIIEQSRAERLEGAEDLQDKDMSGIPSKQHGSRCDSEAKEKVLDRPFSCDICGRCFKELTVLKAHGVVHSDERKFVCTAENCPYGFKTKGGLVRHMRRHTGERPYACENCGRAFSESGALTRHMKSRRNCAQMPDSAYPRYMKNWTYHPNIPAVIDPSQRDVHQGRSTLHCPDRTPQDEVPEEEIHYLITGAAEADVLATEIIAPHVSDVGEMAAVAAINHKTIVPHLVGGAKPLLEIKLEHDNAAETVDWNASLGTVNTTTNIITVASTEILGEVMKPSDFVIVQQESTPKMVPQQACVEHKGSYSLTADDQQTVVVSSQDADLELKNNAEVMLLKLTQCQVCRKDLGAIEGLEIHLRSHLADQPSRCGLCHFLSNDREELRHHILSMHHNSLNDIEASVLAMEEEDGGIKTEATQDKKTTTRDALIAVKQLYSLKKQKSSTDAVKSCPTASGSLQCMVCNRFFRGSSYLRQHMRTHTGDRPHQCHVCHRSFTSRDILKKHMYVHKEQRDFKCGECGKLFKRLAHVQQHLRIHSQERTFRCCICDKLFKTQNSLTVHMRTHSGVNPYKCHICSRHFRERGSLQRHMRLHTGEKPYKCHLCNRAFAEHGTLSRHLRTKVPCTSSHSVAGLDQAGNSTMLSQFSTVVANTQQYIHHTSSSQQNDEHTESSQHFISASIQKMGESYVVVDTLEKCSEEVIENVEIVTDEGMPSTEKSAEDFDGQETETLHIFDSETGESVIIVAEKSIVDLIREQQESLELGEAGSSLRIRDILQAVGNLTSSIKEDPDNVLQIPDVADADQQKHNMEPDHITMVKQGKDNTQSQSEDNHFILQD